MSRIFWDTMLFIYLLEGHRKYASQVRTLLERSYERGDVLLTSYLALAEMMVGAKPGTPTGQMLITTIEEMGFELIGFDKHCVEPFRQLRSRFGLRAPDAMHLSCAAAGRTDLFLTGDEQLLRSKLHYPGIHFIGDFENPPF